jgi:hypothetical protein
LFLLFWASSFWVLLCKMIALTWSRINDDDSSFKYASHAFL